MVVERGVVLCVSGRITGDDLPILRAALDEGVAALDLAQIELVDRDAVNFFAVSESTGTALTNCPAFIREWITRERGSH